MLKGKNILWGTALYLGTIYALYQNKKVTYKDQTELEASNPRIKIRADMPVGDAKRKAYILQQRQGFMREYAQTAVGQKDKNIKKFQTEYEKQEYVR